MQQLADKPAALKILIHMTQHHIRLLSTLLQFMTAHLLARHAPQPLSALLWLPPASPQSLPIAYLHGVTCMLNGRAREQDLTLMKILALAKRHQAGSIAGLSAVFVHWLLTHAKQEGRQSYQHQSQFSARAECYTLTQLSEHRGSGVIALNRLCY